MTPEEAIKILNDTPVEISSGSKTTTREYNQMLHLAENAFEKQIKKKPINKEKYLYSCPSCNSMLDITEEDIFIYGISAPSYCEDCGQALDWRDTE